MPRKRRGRQLDGVLLFDKPSGVSSNHILQRVRRLYGAAKAGHTGSLDPLATGLLPICFGESTKFSQYLLDADKGYLATGHLGVTTTTSDAEGEVLKQRPVEVSTEQLATVCDQFLGESQQVPSMYSALKHQGQPLYKLARAGVEVERKARTINITHLRVLSFHQEQFDIEVTCSKGTYIRNLVEDIGEQLGCGAHVAQLRRTKVGHFEQQPMVTIETLEQLAQQDPSLRSIDQLLLPVDAALEGYSSITLDPQQAADFAHGQSLNASFTKLASVPLIKVYRDDQRFLGIAEINDEQQLKPVRLLAS